MGVLRGFFRALGWLFLLASFAVVGLAGYGLVRSQLADEILQERLELLAADYEQLHERYAAVIALGAVIRGATPHFDIVAGESAKALSSLSLAHSLPVINAILTTDTIEQAIERAGTKAGNKGADAAMSAMEKISLLRKIS